MSNRQSYQYYVEGENEKCIINALKTDLRCVIPGKVEVFNVVQDELSVARIRPLKTGVIVILVYDTDIENTVVLEKNIQFLKRQKAIKEVLCIPQVHNLEEELIYSCNIRHIQELTGSRSQKDFKKDLLDCSNIGVRLKKCGFSIEKFWSRMPQNSFASFSNHARRIKLKNEEYGKQKNNQNIIK